MTQRYPHRRFSHLVLIDYLSLSLPEAIVACPADRQRIQWQADKLDRDNVPDRGGWEDLYDWWWFSSTYQVVPESWTPDKGSKRAPTITQAPSNHILFGSIRGSLGGHRLQQVTFPSQKVFMFEFHDRHTTARGIFYAYQDAASSVMAFDGSARVLQTKEANPGGHPSPQALADEVCPPALRDTHARQPTNHPHRLVPMDPRRPQGHRLQRARNQHRTTRLTNPQGPRLYR